MIGLAITLFFGLFGAVMAVLSYNRHTPPVPVPEPTSKSTLGAPPAIAPPPQGDGKGDGKSDGKGGKKKHYK